MKRRPTSLPNFRFRAPHPDDLDALMAIEEAAFRTDRLSRRRMQHWMGARNRVFLVCDAGKAGIAGYLLIFFRRNSRYARLYSIVIDKPFRGYGLSRKLLARGEAAARKAGCLAMRLEVQPRNKPAIGLYETLGYKRFGFYKEFYEDGGDALRMEKQL